MRSLLILVLTAATPFSSMAEHSVVVSQLRGMLTEQKRASMSADEAARRIGDLKLTEELTQRTLNGLQAEFKLGPKTIIALTLIADDRNAYFQARWRGQRARLEEGFMPEAQALPVRPDLNWYKKAAKKRLNQLRAHHPDTRLADAQLSIAREHDFSSWRVLKDRLDQLIDLPKLFDEIRNDDRPAIRELIKANPRVLRLAGPEGQTAIHVAAEFDNPDVIGLLLRHAVRESQEHRENSRTP